ncbi:hypothetical protein SEA_APIARY_49 [Rhodococcus phage Apiary]|nr:hypothetical protein SEA_BRAXOADDIE_49 [Rhodococcus phage Braxoaddie]WNM64972.1 hypothetical protein SEA_MASELOP_49 [Rhodococcus phage Maselop]WNM67433.1 hypothetical protein SEA_POLYYUKI_49 [Rhodococcus phage Polyyuki]WNM69857.1 hypothetical protein SEA_APIARY_49 [Rhodococcus phage Apiary]
MALIDGQIAFTQAELDACLAAPGEGYLMVVTDAGDIEPIPGALSDHTWTVDSGREIVFPVQLGPNSMVHGYFVQQGSSEATLAVFKGLIDESAEMTAIEAALDAAA